jgi:hypothetical protein
MPKFAFRKMREQAAPQQRASSLHSVCTVLAIESFQELTRVLIKKTKEKDEYKRKNGITTHQ